MKRILLYIFIIATSATASGQSLFSPQTVRTAFARIATDYPMATLQDLYKSCFQDYFGPAHIVADREGAVRYIRQELAELGISY